jgi:hypothetical protein
VGPVANVRRRRIRKIRIEDGQKKNNNKTIRIEDGFQKNKRSLALMDLQAQIIENVKESMERVSLDLLAFAYM